MKLKYEEMTLKQFSEALGAKITMPGGGAAAGYVVSLGNSLAQMVSNFTIGKKKYREHEAEVSAILERSEKLNSEIVSLIDEDAEEYLKFSALYKEKPEDDEAMRIRDEKLQKSMKSCATVPLKLMKVCSEIVDMHEELMTKGSKMLITDVGVGVMFAKAAVMSSRLNILVNIKHLEDEDFVEKITGEMDSLVRDIDEKCDRIYMYIEKNL